MGNKQAEPLSAAPKIECTFSDNENEIFCKLNKDKSIPFSPDLALKIPSNRKTSNIEGVGAMTEIKAIRSDGKVTSSGVTSYIVIDRTQHQGDPILDTRSTGAPEWGFLHSIPFVASKLTKPDAFKRFIRRWGRCASCPNCRKHYNAKVKATDISKLNHMGVAKFYNDLHNEVNSDNKKELWSLDKNLIWYRDSHKAIWQYGLCRGLYHAAIAVSREDFIKLLDAISELFEGMEFKKSIKAVVQKLKIEKTYQPFRCVWENFDTRKIGYDQAYEEIKRLVIN